MSHEEWKARKVVPVQQFSPREDQLTGEASDLGFRAGEVPLYVEVRSQDGTKEAQYALTLTHAEEGEVCWWELTLTAYAEPYQGESGPSAWVPRKMVIYND
jgi:hypothetical protein